MSKKFEDVTNAIIEDIKDFFNPNRKKNTPYVVSQEEKNANRMFIEGLAEMEKKYRESKILPRPDYDKEIPLAIELEKKSYKKRDEAVLNKEASEELAPIIKEETEELAQNQAEKEQKLDKVEDSYAEQSLGDKQALVENIGALAEKQQSKIIKQGLVNSSINQTTKSDIAEYGNEQFEKIDLLYDQKYNKLKDMREELQKSYATALEEYEIKSAAELTKKVKLLEAEENRRLKEVTDFNKSQEQKELQYKKSRQIEIERREDERKRKQEEKDSKEALEAKVNGGISKADEAQQQKLYKESFDHYIKMDKRAALSLITANKSTLEARIGAKNYYKLLLRMEGVNNDD